MLDNSRVVFSKRLDSDTNKNIFIVYKYNNGLSRGLGNRLMHFKSQVCNDKGMKVYCYCIPQFGVIGL